MYTNENGKDISEYEFQERVKAEKAKFFAAGACGPVPTNAKSDIHVPQINRDLYDRRRTLLARLTETQTSLDIVDSLISALTA